MSEYFDLLGVKITVTGIPRACQTIERWIKGKKKTYVCVAPVSTIVDSQSDLTYRRIINNAGMTTPDGVPLVWLGRLKGHKDINRTYGPDLMLRLCGMSQDRGYRHYFYGGTPSTNSLLADKLQKEFPRLNIAGLYAPDLQPVGALETADVLDQINKANPDVLWVGLGSPKQDYWMYHHRNKLNVPVMIGVGAAFDFIAGTKQQAPLWMRQAGLEWFFRLCCEPGRLWKRYLIGNAKFIYFLIESFVLGKGRK